MKPDPTLTGPERHDIECEHGVDWLQTCQECDQAYWLTQTTALETTTQRIAQDQLRAILRVCSPHARPTGPVEIVRGAGWRLTWMDGDPARSNPSRHSSPEWTDIGATEADAVDWLISKYCK